VTTGVVDLSNLRKVPSDSANVPSEACARASHIPASTGPSWMRRQLIAGGKRTTGFGEDVRDFLELGMIFE
jgi:hypothetical protein